MLLKTSKSKIILLLMIAVGLTAASIDIYIASLPHMVDFFNSTQEMLQFTVSAGIIGTSLSTLFIGPLADAIGRRKLIVGGQLFYGLFALLASVSPNVEFLIAFRFLAGMTACAPFVLGFAVISDLYQRDEAAVQYANMTTCILLSLIIAPLIGGYFAEIKRWDYSFILLGLSSLLSALSLWLYLPETLEKKKKFSLNEATKTYIRVLSNWQFSGMATIPAFLISGVLCFFTNGAFYYIEELHLSEWDYSKHQILIMTCNCAFSFFAGRFIKRFGLDTTTQVGLYLFVIGTGSFSFTAYMYPTTPIILTLPIIVLAAGVGFSFSSITAGAMNLVPDSPGIASALLALIRGVFISIIIGLSGYLYVDQAVEIAYTIFLICIVSIGIYVTVHQQKRRSMAKAV